MAASLNAWHFARIYTYQFIVPMNYDRGSSTILSYMLATHPSSEDDERHDALGLSSNDHDNVLGHAATRG